MSKPTKIILTLIAIIVILCVLAAIAVKIMVNPENVKSLIIKQVDQQTGRQLTIKKLDFSIFPSASVTLNGVQLSNPKDFSANPFLTLKHAKLSVKLLPLIHGKTEANAVEVSGLMLNLEKNKQGKTNWQDLQGQQAKTTAATKKNINTTAQNKNQQTPFNFTIPKINIQNININWTDQTKNQQVQIKNMYFKASHLQNQKAFPFSTGVAFNNVKQKTSGTTDLKGQMTLSPNINQYKIEQANLATTMKDQKGLHKLNITDINATINTNDGIVIKPMNAKFYQGEFNGSIDIGTNLNYTADGVIKNLSAQALLKDLYNYDQFTGTGNVQFHLTTKGDNKDVILKNLNGAGQFAFKNGQYKGLDVAYIIRQALSLVNKSIKPVQNQGVTKFGSLSGSFNIKNGLVSNDVILASPVIELKAAGTTNLPTERIKYKGTATAMQGSLQSPQPIKPSIPFILSGNFEHHKLQPNIQALLQNTLKNQLGKHLKDKLKGLNINSLFGN
jgi:uncharacterized protein involved in outer membrane biogenesis